MSKSTTTGIATDEEKDVLAVRLRTRRFITLLLLLTVALAACSGDDADVVAEADHDQEAEIELSADEFVAAAPAEASTDDDVADDQRGDSEVAGEADDGVAAGDATAGDEGATNSAESDTDSRSTPLTNDDTGSNTGSTGGSEPDVVTEESAVNVPGETSVQATNRGPDGELCTAALQIERDDPIGDLSVFEDAYYPAADTIYRELGAVSSGSLTDDIVVVRSALARVGVVLAANDLFSDEVADAFAELDGRTYLDALDRVDTHLRDVCGVVNTPGNGGDNSAAEFAEDEVDAEVVDGTLGETISLDGPGEFAGSIAPATFDVYEITVPEGTDLTVTMTENEFGEVDPFLRVVAPDGSVFENDQADSDDLGLFDSRVIVLSAAGGDYTIEARSFFNLRSGDFVLNVDFG